ncbi:NfeD family protein [Acerihabitans arboris]|uniref:NfeD family protein n=1 Tax=Acerihabitans arboris TaxID=2691583 RepID=A0A845SM27_9GAMM|nr:NfeD family protein [Acerihabitans arboris]NDL65049.1 NfeD family protein [Acerihabitans arboris]
MLAALLYNPHWFWISLGGLLLAAEMLGASGYMLWSGIAAVLVGLAVWVVPLDWEWQGAMFALLTICAALGWWYWLRTRSKTYPASLLNRRGDQLIGVKTVLSEPLVNGVGRVRIGDSTWRARCDTDLAMGTQVEVIAVDGITLRVRPRDENS